MTSLNTPESADQSGSKTKKFHVACLRCRERKVRCSGSQPCANCQRRSTECVFEPEDRKVVVSENYLNELKRKAAEGNDSPQCVKRHKYTPKPSKVSSPVDTAHNDVHSHDEPEVDRHIDSFSAFSNPLVTTPPQFVTDIRGRKRFLGPSSTWAYSRHIMSMIRHNLDQKESTEVPLNVDGAAYALQFPNMKNLGSISMEDLPSLDHALYLTNTVKFHAGQTYHLFHEQTFMQGLFSLYNHGPDSLNVENRIWFVHFFVIMALGKALLARGASRTNPPGSGYFIRALELLPDVNGLYRDPITAVEVCCSLALYLQSVDHRNSAFVYLGLGLRIALTQGYHRDLGGNPGCHKDASRYRGIWWTLYILDRKFSTLIGAPSSIHDSDISVPFPKPHQSAQKSCALDMHVRLSRLLAKVLNTVYCVDEHLNSSFLRNIQETVRELADLATEMNGTPELKLSNTDPISRVSATVNLCYHQCIVLAIRPLLVCLLRDKLDRRSRKDRQDTTIIEPVKALLRTAYESAQKSLRVLTRLQAQDLLGKLARAQRAGHLLLTACVEYFLPFDLDHVFSAGFVLSLIAAVHPASADGDERYLETPYSLLDTLIAGGNVPACFKRQELNCLRDMLRCLMEPHSCTNPQGVNETRFLSGTTCDLPQHGVSPNEMLALASLLEGDSMVQIDPEVVDSWLWESVGVESVPAMDQPTQER